VVSGPALHKGLVLTGCLLAVFVAEALALLVTSGSESRRRSRFWLRFLSAGLTMPGLFLTLVLAGRLGLVSNQLAAGLSGFLFLCCIPAMMLVPALLFDFSGPAPGEEGDGGGGHDPEPPPPPDTSPRGDVPLPDAEIGRWRLRDHTRRERRHARLRRPAPQRERGPARPRTQPRAQRRLHLRDV
jgi:hypothetical protein